MDETNLTDAEKIRLYFKDFIDVYVLAAEKANLPADRKNLEKIIKNAEFQTFEIPDTTGTFSVNRNSIRVVINNFRKNGPYRNNFLLLHEFAHLDSSVNKELFSNQTTLLKKLNAKAEKFQNPSLTGVNAYYGLIAIDEVLAQWTCEELNDVLKDKKRESHSYTKGPLDSDVKFTSDFSDNDIYSPLQPVVQNLIRSLGYSDMRKFTTSMLASDKGIADSIDGKNFEKLCQIGIICKAIYKEQGFNPNLEVSREDVMKAYEFLNKNIDFGENTDGIENR